MGVFKQLGGKLKRVVSLKNLVNGVTGNFSAIGKDVVRVATTSDPKSKVVQAPLLPKNYEVPSVVNDFLESKGDEQNRRVAKIIGSQPLAQKGATLATRAYIQAMWVKYRNYIIGVSIVITVFLVGRKLLTAKRGSKRR